MNVRRHLETVSIAERIDVDGVEVGTITREIYGSPDVHTVDVYAFPKRPRTENCRYFGGADTDASDHNAIAWLIDEHALVEQSAEVATP